MKLYLRPGDIVRVYKDTYTTPGPRQLLFRGCLKRPRKEITESAYGLGYRLVGYECWDLNHIAPVEMVRKGPVDPEVVYGECWVHPGDLISRVTTSLRPGDIYEANWAYGT